MPGQRALNLGPTQPQRPDAKLGTVPTETDQRDAVHVALAPVIAAITLFPGQHVGLLNGYAGPSDAPIGIVDPFLKAPVQAGERFWLLLYQHSITSLRHDWTHPAFERADKAEQHTTAKKTVAEGWLREYAEEVGISYYSLLVAADDFIATGHVECLSHDTPDVVYGARREFWDHYEVLTGKRATDPEATFFRCAC